jgi:FkbM family methyltransferase
MWSRIKNRIRARILERAGIVYNPFGVPFPLGKHLRNRTDLTVIDVGAHEGEFTDSLDRMCGVRAAILIEAQPKRAASLRDRFPQARFNIVEAAVCASEGTIELEINEFDATTSILKAKRGAPELSTVNVTLRETVKCRATTIDTVTDEFRYPQIDLLKLDIQGAELLALKGALNTVARTSLIWTEVSFKELYQDSCLFQSVYDWLSGHGFALIEIAPEFRSASGELLQANVLFAKNVA